MSRTRQKTPLELCQTLESRGIATWQHGESLLNELRAGVHPAPPPALATPDAAGRAPTQSLLCEADVKELLSVLPHAVVTASGERRITVATSQGPIDLFPIRTEKLEAMLLDFGLSPLAFAYRPTEATWCDPSGARSQFERGLLDATRRDPNVFVIAPRRFWIAARLLSQYALAPSAELVDAARSALAETLDRLPQAAPARREISRILSSEDPARGLEFLRKSGVSHALFPGVKSASESIIARLALRPALRWAAWLEGSATQRALVRLRMPHDIARNIERLQRAHPIDLKIKTLREAGLRKILQRLSPQEIDELIHWRRLELAEADQTEETRLCNKSLDEVEVRFAELRHHREQSGRVQALVLDGKTIMETLGAGPGPQVGRALAHLAQFVEKSPDSNQVDVLQAELARWATAQKSADPA